ncbi:hypothetical protein ACWEMN_04020, partial [Streptomyces mirabilis]
VPPGLEADRLGIDEGLAELLTHPGADPSRRGPIPARAASAAARPMDPRSPAGPRQRRADLTATDSAAHRARPRRRVRR